MRYDRERVDEITLALMYLVLHGGKCGTRAWKGFDCDRSPDSATSGNSA